jgi:hypothetical protein
MTLARRVLALLLLGVAPLIACSLLTSFDEDLLAENTLERCRDRVDNDGDALTDCDDPGCTPFSDCAELTAAACRDGADNDLDGQIDCRDPGCSALPGVCVEQTPAQCSDGEDNDGDSLNDCNDPDCHPLEACQERDDARCSDGIDNDQDGLADCADFDCQKTPFCCTLPSAPFLGDDFSHPAAGCSIHACSLGEPTCCVSGYEVCSSFDPLRWVVWGLPRPRQEVGAFVANEPCGCEPSGIVSVESIHLSPGLRLEVELSPPAPDDTGGEICAGLTVSSAFADDLKQCVGAPLPRLLVGLCLGAPSGRPRIAAIADGVVESEREVTTRGPLAATVLVSESGVTLAAGPLQHVTTPMDPAIGRALVLIHGRGTTSRAGRLVVQDPRAPSQTCRDPSAWLRHLGRGEPVIGGKQHALTAAQPTVLYQAEAKTYRMMFDATPTGSSAVSRIHEATSVDGILWSAIRPVFAADDVRFGARQSNPSLVQRKGKLLLFYTQENDLGGQTQSTIALASSPDGSEWQPVPGAGGLPHVLAPAAAPAWDSLAVAAPAVVELEPTRGALLMLYTGTAVELSPRPAIGAARSDDDGVSWKRLASTAVLAAQTSSELGCEAASLVYDPRRRIYLAWYTHRKFGLPARIDHAVSVDGLSWRRYPEPAFRIGLLGSFDERGVEAPAARIQDDDRIQLWYTGIDASGAPQIGYAENRGAR